MVLVCSTQHTDAQRFFHKRAVFLHDLSESVLFTLDPELQPGLAKVLPPERIVMYDPESTDALFQKMALDRDFQRRIVFDESAYFRRISPWPRSCN